MNKIIAQIPNSLTLGNLACGFLAIIRISEGEYTSASLLVVLAAILDFFDGFTARLLKVSGDMGKELDSLSDLVTFGVAPAFLLYKLAEDLNQPYPYVALLLAVFSSYRLAKFNLDTRQSHSFIGVPTPITGLSVMAWAGIDNEMSEFVFENEWYFAIYVLVISLLLISEFPMPSLKIKKGPLRNYYLHIFLAIVAIVEIGVWKLAAIPVFYFTYVISSILFNFAAKKKNEVLS